jgi:hypothetical protein
VVISGFDWDDDNILHIAGHQFSPEEVEEVFAGDHKVRRARQKLYVALGETFEGTLGVRGLSQIAKRSGSRDHGSRHGRS